MHLVYKPNLVHLIVHVFREAPPTPIFSIFCALLVHRRGVTGKVSPREAALNKHVHDNLLAQFAWNQRHTGIHSSVAQKQCLGECAKPTLGETTKPRRRCARKRQRCHGKHQARIEAYIPHPSQPNCNVRNLCYVWLFAQSDALQN